MKKFLLLTAALLVGKMLPAQDTALTSGKIIFTEKVKLQIKLEGDAAGMADALPTENVTEKVLLFTSTETSYEENKSAPADVEPEEESGVKVKFIMSGSSKTYTDLVRKIILDQRDFMNRIFLVTKPFPETAWKMTGNQKDILGYKCIEAVSTDSTGRKTIVWFTPDIKISGGPASYCNLPGMVLGVNINEGDRTIIAKSIEKVDASDLKIEKPKEGKKVSDAEFKKIMSEKMKEMGMEEGGTQGGAAHVKILIKRQ
ncbi:MAG TPA: GLPGLI family protein [Bacteroidales bacterium]|nr:GLPGLI family protein [Bacteroidales bacterium]